MQIHELPQHSGTPANESDFAVDTGTHTFKIPFASLGEAIITAVTTTINGTVQTVKAAIEALTGRVVTLEGKTATLEAGATWQDVSNSITLTKDTNCSNVTIGAAHKIGKLLFLVVYITPNSDIAAGANVDITYSGFTAKINNDFRILPGIVGVGLYQGWLVGPNIIRFRYMAGSTPWTVGNVAFTAIIPLA